MWISINMLSTTFILLLGILLTFPFNIRNDRYFIVSSPDQCDSLEAPCLTLSSLAANTGSYLQLELILLPGNHTLHSKLAITHINQLCIYSNSLGMNIVCINHAAGYEFTNIAHIFISGVKFLGCGGNRAESVMNFTLVNTIFDGQMEKVINSSTNISNFGSAVIVSQSTVTFLNCTFNGNYAKVGGAINGDLSSSIYISNSTFYHNIADSCGGAIFAGSKTVQDNVSKSVTISIFSSSFSFNEAY